MPWLTRICLLRIRSLRWQLTDPMADMRSPEKGAGVYPVQPTFLAVRELHFIAHRPPSAEDKIDESNVRVSISVGSFSEESKRIQVTLLGVYGFTEVEGVPSSPYSVRVAITGEFVFEDSFPREKIMLWAHRMLPSSFSRTCVSAFITSRFRVATLQLFSLCSRIPTLKIDPAKSEVAVSK